MDALKQWALCLIIGAAAGTFVMAVSPRGSMDKTVRAVVGIFVVAAICSPLANLLKDDLSTEAFADYETDIQSEDMNDYVLEAFCNEVQKRVLSEADEWGIGIKEIFTDAEIDADNCIIIHKITVTAEEKNGQEIRNFSACLSEELGVAVAVNAG